MASGLNAVHAAGIVHADVKLANYLVFPNCNADKINDDITITVKISDFGLA